MDGPGRAELVRTRQADEIDPITGKGGAAMKREPCLKIDPDSRPPQTPARAAEAENSALNGRGSCPARACVPGSARKCGPISGGGPS